MSEQPLRAVERGLLRRDLRGSGGRVVWHPWGLRGGYGRVPALRRHDIVQRDELHRQHDHHLHELQRDGRLQRRRDDDRVPGQLRLRERDGVFHGLRSVGSRR